MLGPGEILYIGIYMYDPVTLVLDLQNLTTPAQSYFDIYIYSMMYVWSISIHKV